MTEITTYREPEYRVRRAEEGETGYPIKELLDRWCTKQLISVDDVPENEREEALAERKKELERKKDELYEKYNFVTSRVEGDLDLYIYSAAGMVKPEDLQVIPRTMRAVERKGLMRRTRRKPVHIVALPEPSFLTCDGEVNAAGTHMILDYSKPSDKKEELVAHEGTHVATLQEDGWNPTILQEGIAMYLPHLMFPRSEYSDYTKQPGYQDVIAIALDEEVIGLSETQLLEQIGKDPKSPEQFSIAYGQGPAFVDQFVAEEGLDKFYQLYKLTCMPEVEAEKYRRRDIMATALRKMGIDPQGFAERLDKAIAERHPQPKPEKPWWDLR